MNPTRKPCKTTSPTPEKHGLWPAEFAAPRETVLVLGCLAVWCALIGLMASGNSLLGLKRVLVIIAGARLQPLLGMESLQSMDAAVLLTGVVLLGVGAYIHVSVGLAVLLALRPWLDGFTYPADNTYFLWASLYLVVVWGIRQFRMPQPLRGVNPILLWGALVLWASVAATGAIQRHTTYNELLLWVGYGALFFVTLNSTPTRVTRRVVLLGLLAGVMGQALFAYPHLYYVLPWLRNELQSNPELLSRWFKGATEFTPELARRFNLNRAFASMVFPNALAALLLLGIAPSVALAWEGRRRLGSETTELAVAVERRFRMLLLVALPLFVLVALVVFALGLLQLTYSLEGPPWYGDVTGLSILSALAAALPTTAFLLLGRRTGLRRALAHLQCYGGIVLALTMLGALWISYSRGGMLALAGAVGVSLVLFFRRGAKGQGGVHRAAVFVLVGGLIAFLAQSTASVAQMEDSREAPLREVSAEGMDVSVAELANPASFAARIGYWRVALRMAAANPWRGVGLGNFGMAYGPLQDIDAGDVRNAHSFPLQMLCETGAPGLLLFLMFWGCFVVTAVGYIRGKLGKRSGVAVGLAVALLAFLLHGLIDINFSHPSLVMMAMAALGLFYSELSGTVGTRLTGGNKWLPLLIIVFATIAAGLMMRPFLQSLGLNGGRLINVSKRAWSDTREQAGTFFVVDGTRWARAGKEAPAPRIPVSVAVSLLPEREQLFGLGQVLFPDPTTRTWVPLAPDAALPPQSVFVLQRPWDAHYIAMERLERWVDELIFLDARYPYDPDLALLISRVLKMMAEEVSTHQEDRRDAYLAAMVTWAERAVERSPLYKDMHQHLAWTYWTLAATRQGQASIDCYEKALAEFALSQELGHLEPRYYFAHAGALEAMGRSYRNQGVLDVAARYEAEGAAVRAAGTALQAARWERGLQ